MSLKYGLLGILNYSEMTGYELAKAFHDSLSYFWEAQTSQIYRELNKLEEEGCLTSRIEIQTDKPNKRIYTVTDNGRKALQEWLQKPMPVVIMPSRSEVLMRLFFAANLDREKTLRELRALKSAYREAEEQMGSIEGNAAEYGRGLDSERDLLYWDMTAEFGRDYCKMCQEWADKCIRRLEVGKEAGISHENTGFKRQSEREKQ